MIESEWAVAALTWSWLPLALDDGLLDLFGICFVRSGYRWFLVWNLISSWHYLLFIVYAQSPALGVTTTSLPKLGLISGSSSQTLLVQECSAPLGCCLLCASQRSASSTSVASMSLDFWASSANLFLTAVFFLFVLLGVFSSASRSHWLPHPPAHRYAHHLLHGCQLVRLPILRCPRPWPWQEQSSPSPAFLQLVSEMELSSLSFTRPLFLSQLDSCHHLLLRLKAWIYPSSAQISWFPLFVIYSAPSLAMAMASRPLIFAQQDAEKVSVCWAGCSRLRSSPAMVWLQRYSLHSWWCFTLLAPLAECSFWLPGSHLWIYLETFHRCYSGPCVGSCLEFAVALAVDPVRWSDYRTAAGSTACWLALVQRFVLDLSMICWICSCTASRSALAQFLRVDWKTPDTWALLASVAADWCLSCHRCPQLQSVLLSW